jgi:hypothetical protein
LVDSFCQLIHILVVPLHLLNYELWGPVVFKLGAQRYTSSSTTRIFFNYLITNPLIEIFLGLVLYIITSTSMNRSNHAQLKEYMQKYWAPLRTYLSNLSLYSLYLFDTFMLAIDRHYQTQTISAHVEII